MLARVPNQLTPINKGLTTLEFQSLSVSPKNPGLLQDGTQDNGTFQFNGSTSVWPQIIYGDGGQSGFNATDDALRFNTFTGQASDVNFPGGDPTAWVVATGVIRASPEGSNFYPPIISDPTQQFASSISRARSPSGARRTGAASRRTSRRIAPSSRPRRPIRRAVTSSASASVFPRRS
jgi:hypothetical protein